MRGNPELLRRFVADHIPSLERLEILLLLFHGKDEPWSEDRVERSIRSRCDSIRRNLSALVASRLVTTDADDAALYRYQPADAADGDVVVELARRYRTNRVAMVELIYCSASVEGQRPNTGHADPDGGRPPV